MEKLTIGGRWKKMKRIWRERRRKRRTLNAIKTLNPLATNNNTSPRYIVSLTSYGKRLTDTAPYAIVTLLDQNVKPDKVVLWVANEDRENVPPIMEELVKKGLEIRFCEDIKSYKKLIPAIESFPEDYIITADDDLYYPCNWFEQLLTEHRKNPKKIICHRAHGIKVDVNHKLLPYNEWDFCIRPSVYFAHNLVSQEHSLQRHGFESLFPTGGAGALYPPYCLHKEVTNKDLFMKLAPKADDIWFWAMAVTHQNFFGEECPYIIIEGGYSGSLQHIDTDQTKGENALWNHNLDGGNDIQLKAVIERYPQLMTVLEKIEPSKTTNVGKLINGKEPVISILVPIYNTKEYLPQCLDSILNQTLRNIEVICVNDASTDDSLRVLNKYAQKDSRIILINKPRNEGLPQARRSALAVSRGQYILPVDSDDWIEKNTCEELYSAAVFGGYDIICCGYIEERKRHPFAVDAQVLPEDKLQRMKYGIFGFGNAKVVWNKLVKRDVYEKIVFPIENHAEDCYISCQNFYYADKIGYYQKPLYHWRRRTGKSLTLDKSLTQKRYEDRKAIYEHIIEFCREKFGDDLSVFEPELSVRMNSIEEERKEPVSHKKVGTSQAKDQPKPTFSEKNILIAIDKAIVVSFDIFDTLLTRPFVKPADLFYYIEKSEKMVGFAQNRINAETNARQIKKEAGEEDITYDDIYEQVDKKFAHLKEKELQIERNTLRVNPEVKRYFDYAKNKKKRIIIVSDMYLSSDFLEEIMCKNGITGYEKLYLSNEYGKTKISSNLYGRIISELKVVPQNVVHIGDNEKSDYEMALKVGLNACLYIPIIRQFFAKNSIFENFYSKNPDSVGTSILTAVWSYRWKIYELGILLPNYWEKQGFYYAGTIAIAFTKFMMTEAKRHNIDKILFLARDGFLLQEVFNILGGDTANEYVYAPRIAEWDCFLSCDGDPYTDASVIAEHIIERYKNESDEFASICDESRTYKIYPLEFINKHKDLLMKLSETPKNNFRNYFNTKCGNNTLIVDLISREFTSQRFIENLTGKKIKGIYLFADKQSSSYDENRMISWGDRVLQYWSLWEFMITSPEPPILDITQEQKPIYKESISIFEKFRNIAFLSVEKGAIDFVKEIVSMFGEDDIFVDFEEIYSLSESFAGFIDKQDIEDLSCLFHAKNHIRDDYRPIFPQFVREKTSQDITQMLEEHIKHLQRSREKGVNGFDYFYHYRHWHDSSQKNRRSEIKLAYSLFEHHNLFPKAFDSKVLEVGCGMGRYLAMLKQYGFSDLTGIDIDLSQAQIAKHEDGLKIYMTDVSEFFNGDDYESRYDCIYMFDVFEHIKKDKQLQVLKTLNNHLSDNGMLVIQVPNALSPLGMCYRYLDWTHEISFTDHSIEFLLHNAGLHYIVVRPQWADSIKKTELKKAWADLYLAEIGRVPILALNIVAVAFKNKEAFMFWKNKLPYMPDTYYGIV